MARGNPVEGKKQRSFYLSEDIVEALRLVSYETRESQSAIVERALRNDRVVATALIETLSNVDQSR